MKIWELFRISSSGLMCLINSVIGNIVCFPGFPVVIPATASTRRRLTNMRR
jgi:hypothetical protein